MKLKVSFPKAALLFSAFILFFAACSKKDTVDGSSGGDDDGGISLTTPVVYTGNVPAPPDAEPSPEVRAEYAPFVGVWKQNYGDETYVFLPDGRVAFEKQNNGQAEVSLGMYFKNSTDNFFDFVWMMNIAELHLMTVDGDVLSLVPNEYTRVGDADAAATEYNAAYDALMQTAETNNAKFPVGTVINSAPDPHDPHPGKVIKNAKVFTTGIHFQDSFTSDK